MKNKPLSIGTELKHPCPDCGGKMVLRRSKYGLFYGCVKYPECKAAHGAHTNTGQPLGKPADKETKEWRIKAHSSFDSLWKKGDMKRKDAYRWLREQLQIEASSCHIGMFDIDQCKQTIDAVKEYFNG